MKLNQIIHGDAIAELSKLPDNSVDLIFADPPYWMRVEGTLHRVEGTEFDGCDDDWDQFDNLEQYEKFTKDWLSACHRVLKPNGSIWVIGGMQCIYSIGAIMQQIGFWLINDVVWHKKNPTPNFKGTRLNNSQETLIWATKSKKSKYTFHYKTAKELNTDTVTPDEYAKGTRKQMGSVWRFSVCSGNERLKNNNGEKIHSTQKPIEMLERIIAISSNKNELVLDPFGGTMTTAAAAKRLGRNYLTIERSAEYCRYGQQRLDSITFNSYPEQTIANAELDEKPLKVSMQDMIKANFFLEGEWFYLKNGEPQAVLLADGKLLYNGEPINMHTCAALAKKVKAERLNGFDHWYVMRENKLVPIDEVRAVYRDVISSEHRDVLS